MNKVIWTYWHQGFDQAPNVVQHCLRRVKKLNSDYELHLLDKESVYQYTQRVPIPEDKWERMSLAHRSDLLRTQLLIKHGGVWMDPTVYCMKPLDEWLQDYMQTGVFFFYRIELAVHSLNEPYMSPCLVDEFLGRSVIGNFSIVQHCHV